MESLRRQFENMMVVIIDEMSLVGADFFYNVHKRLAEVMRNDDFFANRAVLLVGDLLQIPPTGQKAIFDEPTTMQNKALYKSDGNLWDSFDTVQLLVNKRQGVCEWRETLDRIRIGQMNDNDKKLLETRRVSNEEHKSKDFDKALHLFFGNQEVCNHNKSMINKLPGPPSIVQADIRGYPKGCYPSIKYETFVEDTRFQKFLTLKKGSRVILNFNVDISDGLVNGVTGTVIDIPHGRNTPKYQEQLSGSKINAVIVKFDDPAVGEDLRKKHTDLPKWIKKQKGVPIYRMKMTMYPKKLSSSAECSVEQFPLNLFYASTSHKIQGRTLENQDVVCYTDKNIKAGCGYVMLSRNTKKENVYIAKDFDLEKVNPHLPSLKVTNQLIKNCMAAELKKQRFDIFYVNQRGKSNLINVQHDPYARQSDLVCLVETNLESGAVVQWPGRKCFPHASSGRGTGVCAFANQTEENPYHFQAKEVHNRFQILQLTMHEVFQIFILYVSQDADLDSVANTLQEMMLDDHQIIVFGDFNFHSDPSKSNDLSIYLTEGLQLQQIVSGPTYVSGPNTIDHIYVPKDLADCIQTNSRFNYYSDHMSFNICLQ